MLTSKKTRWEDILSSGTYFDCGDKYTEDLLRRIKNKNVMDTALSGIGVKFGEPQELGLPLFFDVEKEGQDWSMLEIGCGYGLYAAHFCSFIRTYIGVDVSDYIVGEGNKALREVDILNAKLFQVNNCNLDFLQNNHFDLVFTAAVFIHTSIEVTRHYLQQTYYKLKKGGRFLHHFNMTYNKSNVDKTESFFRKAHFYTEDELMNVFEGTGLSIQSVLDHKPFSPGNWMRYVYGVK